VTNLPLYYRDLQYYINIINDFDFFGFYISLDGIYSSIREFLQNITIDDVFTSVNAILAVPSALFVAILAIISAVYILIEKDRFKKFLSRAIKAFTPAAAGEAIFEFTGKLNKNFKKYLYVQTLYGLIFGVASTIALVAMGSPYFVILGVLLGISNYIPYIGSIVATIFAIVVIAFTQDLTMAIIATIVIFILQQVGANVLHPKMMGQSFKFSPLLVIVSIVVGGAIAGVFGMIVAIPAAVTFKDLTLSVIKYMESRRSKINSAIDIVPDADKPQ
jgi:predicted PurR-regulated permease PerM